MYRFGAGVKWDSEKYFILSSKAYDWLSNNSHLNDPEIWSDLGQIKKDDDLLFKAAEQGFADAQHLLSQNYMRQKDFKKAVYWCTLAAEQGIADAQIMLSDMYESGCGVEQDIEQSVFWYRQSAEQVHHLTSPKRHLNRLYGKKIYIEKDSDQPIYWILKAVEHGRLDWSLDLAYIYKEIKNYEKAIYWFERTAELHEVEEDKDDDMFHDEGIALFELAEIYENGLGVELNLNKAFSLYVKSADNGSFFATNKLGDIFKDGLLGLEKDYNKAFYWYKKAIESDFHGDGTRDEYGYGHAEYGLGTMYEQGLGVPKDLKKAFDLFHAAEAEGNIKAMVKVAWMYENGKGIEKDYEMAIYWYSSAAESGNADAQTNLTRMYEEGKWVDGY
jgi:TPR repeat protein